MDFWVEALVVVVKLALAGFVMWGGWLSFSTWLRGDAPQVNAATLMEPKPQNFERVASLVLLALLCSTLVAVA